MKQHFDLLSDKRFVTTEVQIKRFYSCIRMNYRPQTINDEFNQIKKILYLYSFYNFYNIAFNINFLNDTFLATDSDWYKYVIPDDFSLLIRFFFEYLKDLGFLLITPPTGLTYSPDNFYNDYMSQKSNFIWHIPQNFMPIFCSFIMEIYFSYKKKNYSTTNFFKNFLDRLEKNPAIKYADATTNKLVTELIEETTKSGHTTLSLKINKPPKAFTKLCELWINNFFPSSYFKKLDFLYTTYDLNFAGHRKALYNSLQGLHELLISSSASPHLYKYIDLLFDLHLYNFSEVCQSTDKALLFDHNLAIYHLPHEITVINDIISNFQNLTSNILNQSSHLVDLINSEKLSAFLKSNYLEEVQALYDSSLEKIHKQFSSPYAATIDLQAENLHKKEISHIIQSYFTELRKELRKFSKIARTSTSTSLDTEQLWSKEKSNIVAISERLAKDLTTFIKSSQVLPLTHIPTPGLIKHCPLNLYCTTTFSYVQVKLIANYLQLNSYLFLNQLEMATPTPPSSIQTIRFTAHNIIVTLSKYIEEYSNN